MISKTESYPLHWPAGWERTKYPKDSQFKAHSLGRIRDELFDELRKMGAKDIVLSTNIRLKQDGLPYATYAALKDTGVAVYFTYKKKQMVFACDRFKKIEDNLHAIAKTISNIRGIERWGASEMLERAFTGFAQLEAPGTKKEFRMKDGTMIVSHAWWDILGVPTTSSLATVKEAYRQKCRDNHPDNGGSHDVMVLINRAFEEATRAIA